MSPEQWEAGSQATDIRSDVYSLACVLYTTLTGVPPLHRETVAATMQAQLNETAPPPSSAGAVPATLDTADSASGLTRWRGIGGAAAPHRGHAPSHTFATRPHAAHCRIGSPFSFPEIARPVSENIRSSSGIPCAWTAPRRSTSSARVFPSCERNTASG